MPIDRGKWFELLWLIMLAFLFGWAIAPWLSPTSQAHNVIVVSAFGVTLLLLAALLAIRDRWAKKAGQK